MGRRACKDPGRSVLAACAAAAVAAATLLAGCSQPLLVFRNAEAAKPASPALPEEPVVTGSIERRPAAFGDDLGDEDWRRAKAALATALDPQGNGRPVKWENPATGLYGSINPTGLPFVLDDQVCRNFLASVVAPGRSRFLRGMGCRPSGGTWTLRRVRPAAGAPAKPADRNPADKASHPRA